MPAWAAPLARNREELKDCVLCVEQPAGHKRYFKFIYSVISPGYLALCHCDLLPQNLEQQHTGWHNIDHLIAS
eukprot:9878748-Lingulodinium_polyedra.AAC.1